MGSAAITIRTAYWHGGRPRARARPSVTLAVKRLRLRDELRRGRYHVSSLTDESQSGTPWDAAPRHLTQVHLRNGWIGLLLFASLGIALESLHAFKSAAYLGVDQEMRRLMWTLAHAHGVGLSLLQVALAATLHLVPTPPSSRWAAAGRLLNAACILIPLGFFLGGLQTYEGDPGLGVWLVPLGAASLLAALTIVVWTLARRA